MTCRLQRFNDREDELVCECGTRKDSLVLRVRNTFYEWPQLPLPPPLRRSSSYPPAAKEPSTSRHSIASIAKVESADQARQPGHAQDSCLPCQADESEPDFEQALEQYGLHPSHPLWIGQTKIMLRNIPSRCKEYELRKFLVDLGIPSHRWVLNMPLSGSRRNRGYAFVTAIDPATAIEIIKVLWQQSIPSRVSQRPLKLQPAACQLENAHIGLR
eukprot:TRINITY_DN44979_c0_g1_i1.p1 TRINITY_DN44979_c0_g1~~TRINITY_DN44979_c0_g1_i1.p1  ORF type:complete len:215 (-),score=31.05 TRINITY_DN44979_c0_g1_i1:168-812(-)